LNEDVSGAVIGSVVIITASTIVRLVKENRWKQNSGRVMVFGFLLGVFLLAIASVSPTIAKVLSGLGIVGTFAVNWPTIFGTVSSFNSSPMIATVGGATGHKH